MRHAVGIFHPGHLLHPGCQACFGLFVHADGLFHQLAVDQNAPIVDFLIEVVFLPDAVWYRIFAEPLENLDFNFYIPDIVSLKGVPASGGVFREIPLPPFRPAGSAEVADKVSAFLQLLLLQTKDRTNFLQA